MKQKEVKRLSFILDGPYRKATHYFNIHSNHLSDNFASSKQTVFPTKLNIKRTKQLGDVIALNSQDYYVQIKGFKKKCLTEPNVCSEGLSVAFWLRMIDGKYIIAGGRYRGSVTLNCNTQFHAIVNQFLKHAVMLL